MNLDLSGGKKGETGEIGFVEGRQKAIGNGEEGRGGRKKIPSVRGDATTTAPGLIGLLFFSYLGMMVLDPFFYLFGEIWMQERILWLQFIKEHRS
jgi:hypothetical protein